LRGVGRRPVGDGGGLKTVYLIRGRGGEGQSLNFEFDGGEKED